MKFSLIFFVIFIVLLSTANSITQSYETTAVSRIIGESPSDMASQLNQNNIALQHATVTSYAKDNVRLTPIIKKQFKTNVNEMSSGLFPDTILDTEDLNQFKKNEFIYDEEMGDATNEELKYPTHIKTETVSLAFALNKPLLLLNREYGALTIPKKDSIIRPIAKDTAVISSTFKSSYEFPRAFICNLRKSGRTLGETFREARNNYHWGTTSSSELIGLTLFSYSLYGNALVSLTTPDFLLDDIEAYCQGYLETYPVYSYSSLSQEDYGITEVLRQPYIKTVTVNLGSYWQETENNFSLLYVNGTSQQYLNSEHVLPRRIDVHEMPKNTIITNISLISLENPVDLNLNFADWQGSLVKRICIENKSAGIDFSHTFSENSEIVIANINPISIIDCEAGKLKLYKKIKYQIAYIPYSPVIIEDVIYPKIASPNKKINITAVLTSVVSDIASGKLVLKSDGRYITEKAVTSSQGSVNIEVTLPKEEGAVHYTLEFMQGNESKFSVMFDLEVAVIAGSLNFPISRTNTASGILSIYNYADTSLNAVIRPALYNKNALVSSTEFTRILNKGINNIPINYSNLDLQTKFYSAEAEVVYGTGSRTFTGSVILNRAPVIENIDFLEITAGEGITLTVKATDADNDGLSYSIDSLKWNYSGNYFVWVPETTDIGEHNFTITVSDGIETASEIFTVKVIPPLTFPYYDIKARFTRLLGNNQKLMIFGKEVYVNQSVGALIAKENDLLPVKSVCATTKYSYDSYRIIRTQKNLSAEYITIAGANSGTAGIEGVIEILNPEWQITRLIHGNNDYDGKPAQYNNETMIVFKKIKPTGSCYCADCAELNITYLVEKISKPEITCYSDNECGSSYYAGERICSGIFVLQNYSSYMCINAGTTNSYCEKTNTRHTIKECDSGCSNGECTEPAEIKCEEDLDCGNDKFISKWKCLGNERQRTYRRYLCKNPGTIDSYCMDVDRTITEICDFGCTEGICKDDSLPYICYKNSDCGTDGMIGGPYCSGKYVSSIDRKWECIYPGTKEAYCRFNDYFEVLQTCEVCFDGKCVNNECSSDDDCGEDFWTGTSYCKNNDVYQTYSEWKCNFNKCVHSESEKLKEDCNEAQEYMCSEGICASSNEGGIDLNSPDLVVRYFVKQSPENPWVNGAVSFAWVVENWAQNKNAVAKNIEWHLIPGDGKTIRGYIASLNPGEAMGVGQINIYKNPGNYTVKLVIDPYDKITELSHTNNEAEITIEVK